MYLSHYCIMDTSNPGNHVALVCERDDIVLVSEGEKERDSKSYMIVLRRGKAPAGYS